MARFHNSQTSISSTSSLHCSTCIHVARVCPWRLHDSVLHAFSCQHEALLPILWDDLFALGVWKIVLGVCGLTVLAFEKWQDVAECCGLPRALMLRSRLGRALECKRHALSSCCWTLLPPRHRLGPVVFWVQLAPPTQDITILGLCIVVTAGRIEDPCEAWCRHCIIIE
jgi:hypothetical protein